jgi:hypothetical protein
MNISSDRKRVLLAALKLYEAQVDTQFDFLRRYDLGDEHMSGLQQERSLIKGMQDDLYYVDD